MKRCCITFAGCALLTFQSAIRTHVTALTYVDEEKLEKEKSILSNWQLGIHDRRIQSDNDDKNNMNDLYYEIDIDEKVDDDNEGKGDEDDDLFFFVDDYELETLRPILAIATDLLSNIYKDRVIPFLCSFFYCPEPRETLEPTIAPTQSSRWFQIGETIHGTNHEKRMGYSVALSSTGKWLATGGYHSLELYQEIKNGWILQHNISNMIKDMAHSISFSSNHFEPYLVIGDGDFGNWKIVKSRVHVFQYKNSTNDWERIGRTIKGLADRDGFGYSVDISGNGKRVAVGSPMGSYVQIFSLNKELDWFLLQQINGTYGFGSAICFTRNGNFVFIGNPTTNNNAGSVGLYSVGGGLDNSLSATQEFFGDNASDWFGSSLAISEDAFFFASGTHNKLWHRKLGYVKVFQFNSVERKYYQLEENIVGEGDFGRSISFAANGERLIVGGWDVPGRITLYKISEYGWYKLGFLSGDEGDHAFGKSVSISDKGNRFVVGSPPNGDIESQLGWVAAYET